MSVLEYIITKTRFQGAIALSLFYNIMRELRTNLQTEVIEVPLTCRTWMTEAGYEVKIRNYVFRKAEDGEEFDLFLGIERVTNTLYWAATNDEHRRHIPESTLDTTERSR